MNEQEFISLLHKYRDEPARVLGFEPSIERLIDSQHCKELTSLLVDHGKKWERRKAVQSLGSMLPATRGLYLFVWRPDLQFYFDGDPSMEQLCWILYVGKAGVEGGEFDSIKH